MAASPHAASRTASPRPFDPTVLAVERDPPSPLPRRVLQVLLALVAAAALALGAGHVDVVAVAEGRLVPRSLLKVVQPAETGIVQEVLVEEGMEVVAGQPLLRLDARLAEADLRALKHELAVRALQVRRIDAELGRTPLAGHAGDPPAVLQQARAQLEANRAAHLDQLGQQRAAVARLARELDSARAIERKLARTLPIVQTASARFDRLHAEGFVSELAALERTRERVEREHDHAAQTHSVAALEAALAQAERQVDATQSAYRRALAAERHEAAAQLARLREEVDKQLVRRDRIELAAPQAGVVKDVATRTVGSVVATGTVLVTLVPAGDPLDVEVLVRNDDAGFVHAGQRAAVKVAAYPFQKYGLLPATVLRVGPDAADATERDATAREPRLQGAYRARLALAEASIDYEGTRLPLVSGMVVQAEIHLGRRPLLDYLLAPVQKAWHEAARER